MPHYKFSVLLSGASVDSWLVYLQQIFVGEWNYLCNWFLNYLWIQNMCNTKQWGPTVIQYNSYSCIWREHDHPNHKFQRGLANKEQAFKTKLCLGCFYNNKEDGLCFKCFTECHIKLNYCSNVYQLHIHCAEMTELAYKIWRTFD